MLTGVQIRMARNALRWSVKELADHSGISTSTITRAETVDGVPKTTRANLLALKDTLAAAGIEFTGSLEEGFGVRLKPSR